MSLALRFREHQFNLQLLKLLIPLCVSSCRLELPSSPGLEGGQFFLRPLPAAGDILKVSLLFELPGRVLLLKIWNAIERVLLFELHGFFPGFAFFFPLPFQFLQPGLPEFLGRFALNVLLLKSAANSASRRT